MLMLSVRGGPDAGAVFEVMTRVELGRHGQLRLSDPAVSRRHVRLAADAQGRWVIRDLGSRYGTYINGRRVKAAAVLVPGDQIRLGSTMLAVERVEGPLDKPQPSPPCRWPADRPLDEDEIVALLMETAADEDDSAFSDLSSGLAEASEELAEAESALGLVEPIPLAQVGAPEAALAPAGTAAQSAWSDTSRARDAICCEPLSPLGSHTSQLDGTRASPTSALI